MTNETNKQLSETKQLRGTFDQVIRQINETYNASNGWAITRTSSVLVNFSVWLERSVKQSETKVETLQVNTSETPEKDVVNTEVESAQTEGTKVDSNPKTAVKRTTAKK